MKSMNTIFRNIALVILFVLANLQSNAQQPSFVKDSLDAYMQRVLKTWNLPGIAICIVKDGNVVVSKGYGIKEIGKNEPVDNQTLFQIASNSKAFTALSLSCLDIEKRLTLDDKVQKYIPYFKMFDDYAAQNATLRDLLCHRLGFETFQGDFLHWGSNLSRKDLITHIKNLEPVYPFRYKYGYCNVAFLTAGEVIPVVTDTSWDDFVKARFFKPLKMTRSTTHWSDLMKDNNTAKPHTVNASGTMVEIPVVNIDNLGPAASISSCVNDLSSWMIMHLDSGRFEGNQIVPYKALKQMYTPNMLEQRTSGILPGNHFTAYGLGLEMYDVAGRKVISHTGGSNGFVSMVCMVPEEKLGIAVLTNNDVNLMFMGAVWQVLDAYFNQPYRDLNALLWKRQQTGDVAALKEYQEMVSKVKSADKPILPLSAFEGTYSNPVYGNMTVVAGKKNLTASFEHHPDLKGEMEYMGNDTFLCTYSDPTYSYKAIPFTITNGQVTSCKVTVNDFIDFMDYNFKKEK